jgi:hypothetical protein
MTLIEDLDLATYCGRIGNLYTRYGLSPPFALHDAAQGWIARDILLSHCVDVIERYLTGYGRSCPSGSGDRNFAWLNSMIQTTWYERSFAVPPRPTLKDARHHDCFEEYDAEEPNQRPSRRAAFTAGPPNSISKLARFEPGGVGLRQKTAKAFSQARDTRSAFPQQGPQPPRSAPKSPGQELAPSPKKIDVAVAWLRAELASGEQPAARVEANALCAGIAPRTYDRARKRLGVTSRRIGFGRWAKYMIALPPAVDGTPSKGANMAGAT